MTTVVIVWADVVTALAALALVVLAGIVVWRIRDDTWALLIWAPFAALALLLLRLNLGR